MQHAGALQLLQRGQHPILLTGGEPVALDVASAPAFGDPHVVVLWTDGVSMDVRVDAGGIGSLLHGGSKAESGGNPLGGLFG